MLAPVPVFSEPPQVHLGKHLQPLQHWLPASYLQFFAVSGTPEGRDSVVYVTTADKSRTRKVKNVAASNFLYSKLDPKAAEERFHRAEGDYPRLLRKVLSGAPLQKGPDRGESALPPKADH